VETGTPWFGDIIPTTVLTSIGVHGWTFEALCCELAMGTTASTSSGRCGGWGTRACSRATGHGDRASTSGWSPSRTAFRPRQKLEAVLRAYVKAWPQIATAVQRGFETIARERPRGDGPPGETGGVAVLIEALDEATSMIVDRRKRSRS
jgi:hypothetical protein